MKRFVVSAILGLAAAACATDEVSTVSSEATTVGRYLVVFKAEVLPKDAATKFAKAGGTLVRKLDQVGLAVFRGTGAAADKLAKDASVLAVGAEHAFRFRAPEARKQSDTPVFDWALGMQWDMRRIGAPALWQRGLPRASTVAVIDTGIMYDHEDLAANVVDSKTTSYCNGDPSGYPVYDQIADLTHPDFCVPNNFDHYPWDAFHGTHVSGTVAAPINGMGIVGVSPTTGIASYKVFDIIFDGQGYGFGAFDFPIFHAIVDSVMNGHKVINMSLGGGLDRSIREHNAAWLAWSRVTSWAYRKGTLIVAAAGNDTTNNNGTISFVPSDLPSVMSVSATGATLTGNGWFGEEVNAVPGTDVLTFYSNFGAAVDIAAPGGDCGPDFNCDSDLGVQHLILSTCPWPNNIDLNTGEMIAPTASGYHSVYCWAAGTSMAAPHVAGVAAAARAVRPNLTAGETRSLLKSTAFAVGGRQGFGAGIVNADAATK